MSAEDSGPGTSRLVGRERDFARLRSLVADPPPGALIMVIGEAGVGKTALVNQLVAERLAVGDRVLRGAGDSRATARFSMWRRVIRDLGLALPHADPSVGAADQVDELAATIGDSLASGDWTTVVLEDAHWADGASVDVLQLVVDRIVGCSVAVVATARSGAMRGEALAGLQRSSETIALTGLTPADIETLAVHLTDEPLTPAAAAELHRRTGGNPLFLREILAGGTARVSSTSGGLLADSLTALGPVTADVVGAMALAGRAAPLAAVAHAMSMDVDELEAHRRRALDAGVLAGGADDVWFRHELLADAATTRLDATARRAVHLSLADYWATAPNLDDDGLERARHLLAATTSVPRVEDAEIVLNTAVSLRRQRRAGDAADLLQRALDAWGTAPAPFLALLWMGLGEARWDLSEKPAALECFDRAAESAGELDIAAVASIEIARQRYHNPFIPDPAARQRLADLDDQLATDDSALRAALLGRRAMLALQPPARRHEASAFADAAVSMARRIDDSDALLTALCDRAFVVGSAHDVLCRKDLAEEVVEIARITGRPDGAIAGHEWRFDDCLMRGDLAAAATALEEFEALASVAPSPYWRYASSFRRAMLLVVQGDRDGAVDSVEASGRASSGLVDHFERVGVELGVRAPAMILYGLADPEVAALHGQMIEVFDRVPSPFMQVRLAVGELLVGDRTAASRRATRWLADPARAYEALDPVGTLGLMAILADELQMAEPAVAIVGALDEFRGLLVGEILLPVDLLLAQLALLAGRTADAVARAHSALGLARAMPSPVVEALCLRGLAEAQLAAGDRAAAAVASAAAAGIAERIGLSLAAPWSRRATDQEGTARSTADAGPRTARLERDGDVWRIQSGSESATLAHITGLELVARLVQVPQVEIKAAELTGTPQAPASDLGPALDARAKREYRLRINELNAEIDNAEEWADPERAETARRELDALMAELRRAVGLGDRDRPQGSGSERARINAARNIRRAISAIDKVAPQLAAHLTVSIRTGYRCSYAPEPAAAIQWQIKVER